MWSWWHVMMHQTIMEACCTWTFCFLEFNHNNNISKTVPKTLSLYFYGLSEDMYFWNCLLYWKSGQVFYVLNVLPLSQGKLKWSVSATLLKPMISDWWHVHKRIFLTLSFKFFYFLQRVLQYFKSWDKQ